MSRIGIAFSGGAARSEIVECVRLAEVLGYESASIAEGHRGDQFAVRDFEAYRRSGIGVPILSPFARGSGAKVKLDAVIRACAPSADRGH
jgi:alkanesulfonate monooxygenase SsuD/methylene tetrahydromethanopterin reductase-like flavin-dependent oxidoreductase (luciferase family)